MIVLVTGGMGFIGSAFIRLGLEKGYKIVNLDNLSYASTRENLRDVDSNKNYVFEHADVRDKEKDRD